MLLDSIGFVVERRMYDKFLAPAPRFVPNKLFQFYSNLLLARFPDLFTLHFLVEARKKNA